jgi:hypothetical protein
VLRAIGNNHRRNNRSRKCATTAQLKATQMRNDCWPGVLTIRRFALDLLECWFQYRGRPPIQAFYVTKPRFIFGTVDLIAPAQALQ